LIYRILGISVLVVFFGILIDSQDAFAEHIVGVQNWDDPSDSNQKGKTADLYTIFVSGCGDSIFFFNDGENLKGWLKQDLAKQTGGKYTTAFHFAAWHWFNNHRDPEYYKDSNNVDQLSKPGPLAMPSDPKIGKNIVHLIYPHQGFSCGSAPELYKYRWDHLVNQAKAQLDGVGPLTTCYYTVQNQDGSPSSRSIQGMDRCKDTQNQCTEKKLTAGQCKKIKCVQYKSGEKPPNCTCGVKTTPTYYWTCSYQSPPPGYTSISGTKQLSKTETVTWKGWKGQEAKDPIIPKDAKLIIMGHSLGGYGAYRIATEVDRQIDLLYLSDPVGPLGQRASGTITPNVKHFQMHYQTQGTPPVNYLSDLKYTIQDPSKTSDKQSKIDATHTTIAGNDNIQKDLRSFIDSFVRIAVDGPLIPLSSQNLPSSWSDWQSFSSSGLSSVAAAKKDDGGIEIFASSTSSPVFHKWQDKSPDGWEDNFPSLGGNVKDVSATKGADEKIHVFVVATNGELFETWQDWSQPTGWSPDWKSRGGVGFQRVDTALKSDGYLAMVGTGDGSGPAYIRMQNGPGVDNWTDFESLGGTTYDVSVTKIYNGGLGVFAAHSPNGNVMFKYQTNPGQTPIVWSGWNNLGGKDFTRVSANQVGYGNPVVYGTGNPGGTYVNFQNDVDGVWSGWIDLKHQSWDVGSERNADGRHEVFVVGQGGTIYHKSQKDIPPSSGPQMITRADSDFFDEPDQSEMEVMESKVLPPALQVSQGISAEAVTCKEGLQKLYKSADGSPLCVTESTAEKLIARGWAS